MLDVLLPLLDETLHQCIRSHHERHCEGDGCDDCLTCTNIRLEFESKRKRPLGEVQPQLWLVKHVTHDCLQRVGRVRNRSGHTACIEEHGYRIVAILAVRLLDEELPVLSTNFVSLIINHIVHLLSLVEEMIVGVGLDWLVAREQFARAHIRPEVLLDEL